MAELILFLLIWAVIGIFIINSFAEGEQEEFSDAQTAFIVLICFPSFLIVIPILAMMLVVYGAEKLRRYFWSLLGKIGKKRNLFDKE